MSDLWRPPGHYYSPIVDRDDVARRAAEVFDRSMAELPGIAPGFDHAERLMTAFVERGWTSQIPWATPRDEHRYRFDNDQFRYADAIFLHLMLRAIAPPRIVEIGSGWSTCAMLDTADATGADFTITAIDPDPSRLHDNLRDGDGARVTIHAARIQDLGVDVVAPLCSGDVLFIDSSHVVKTGSDVNHILFELLPRLAPGVWVHVHDVMWPFEYPESWVAEGRSWNEAYAWRAFLMFNDTFAIHLWPSQLMALYEHWFHEHLPLALKDPGGSLWLRRGEG